MQSKNQILNFFFQSLFWGLALFQITQIRDLIGAGLQEIVMYSGLGVMVLIVLLMPALIRYISPHIMNIVMIVVFSYSIL